MAGVPTVATMPVRVDVAPAGLLRLITCGSVDDGKSTLIGRLLVDCRAIHADQLAAVERASKLKNHAGGVMDLSYVTDGLRAEREQGITIDVAYRYFSTQRRTFILADTPGHVQYTRNMATGASTADAAIILIDARHGVVEQTRRHACIATLLGIRHLVVAVNKMDLVGFDAGVFAKIGADFAGFARAARPDAQASIAERASITMIPLVATLGDNIVEPSTRMPFYDGPTLLRTLEDLPDAIDRSRAHARFPVQYVLRPQSEAHHDYRGYAGRVASGTFAVGDEVVVLPRGERSRITRIHVGERELASCAAPQSVAMTLEHDIDIPRGDVIIRAADADGPEAPKLADSIVATVIWMHQQPLAVGRRLVIKHATMTVPAVCRGIHHRLDVNTLEVTKTAEPLGLNAIGQAEFRLGATLAVDPYTRCRSTGAFIIIDEQTNATVGAGLIRE